MRFREIAVATLIVAAPVLAKNQTLAKYTGEVRRFTRGGVLEVEAQGQGTRTFDLGDKTTTYQVDPDIAPGRKVSVVESRDPTSGNKTVVVRLGTHGGAGSK